MDKTYIKDTSETFRHFNINILTLYYKRTGKIKKDIEQTYPEKCCQYKILCVKKHFHTDDSIYSMAKVVLKLE